MPQTRRRSSGWQAAAGRRGGAGGCGAAAAAARGRGRFPPRAAPRARGRSLSRCPRAPREGFVSRLLLFFHPRTKRALLSDKASGRATREDDGRSDSAVGVAPGWLGGIICSGRLFPAGENAAGRCLGSGTDPAAPLSASSPPGFGRATKCGGAAAGERSGATVCPFVPHWLSFLRKPVVLSSWSLTGMWLRDVSLLFYPHLLSFCE